MTHAKSGDASIYFSLMAGIVSAYVTHNPVPNSEMPALIRNVHAALRGLPASDGTAAGRAAEVKSPTPAEIRRSVGRDSIVSFIDGKDYRMLKRHLTSHGFHPQTYRERFGLPPDYPMVAPSYSE